MGTLKLTWPEAEPYRRQKVLITGGLGFLGLNLTAALLDAGAQVTILDVATPVRGLESMLCHVRVLQGDLRDNAVVEDALRDCTVVFNFAGRSGAVASNLSPVEDLEANCRGQLLLLEACRRTGRPIKIVFPSSRLVYRPTEDLPVAEAAPLGPLSIYGIHKLAGEQYHLLYSRLYGLRTTILRITNPYGPFQRREERGYGIVNLFIQRALEGDTLRVYGDGRQLRDYVHINDLIRAFLLCGADERADGRVFNIGGGQPISFRDMAALVVRAAGHGDVEFVEWPANAAQVEGGSFVADIRLIEQAMGWEPKMSFEEGLADVIKRYRLIREAESRFARARETGKLTHASRG